MEGLKDQGDPRREGRWTQEKERMVPSATSVRRALETTEGGRVEKKESEVDDAALRRRRYTGSEGSKAEQTKALQDKGTKKFRRRELSEKGVLRAGGFRLVVRQ